MRLQAARIVIVAVSVIAAEASIAAESLTGRITAQARVFVSETYSYDPLAADISVSLQPRYFRTWNSGQHSIVIEPFIRLDQNDSRRSHFDFRELYWLMTFEIGELSAGFRRVFWGITESQHLVDFINQRDFVEGIESEDRLGQPMISLNLFTHWGDFEFYALPFFRERTYPGESGSLRGEKVVNTSATLYETSLRWRHFDLALRWSHQIGALSFAVGYFSGVNRQPRLIRTTEQNRAELIPHYDLVNRTSLELQIIMSDWIWNLEVLEQYSLGNEHFGFIGGIERSYAGFTGAADLRVVVEYHFDSRGDHTPVVYYNSPLRFQNDLFVGGRVFFNDFQSSEFSAGVFLDIESGELAPFVAVGRRVASNYTLDVSFKGFFSMELARHF